MKYLIISPGPPERIKKLQPPPIPPEEWCDFRIAYEQRQSLKQIADIFFCDPRTVRQCILLNKSSHELGRQWAPTKLTPFLPVIESLYKEASGNIGICALSRIITDKIQNEGYAGSERTVRNYLRNRRLSCIRQIPDND